MDVFAALAVLFLAAVFYAIYARYKKLLRGGGGRRGEGDSKKSSFVQELASIVVFIDSPDPDNPALVAAILKHILFTQKQQQQQEVEFHPHLKVVLTGRPVNLRTQKVSTLESPARQPWEEHNPMHAQMLLKDSAARIENYLNRSNIDLSTVTLYDGGVAPCSPLSDQVHDWDFLFDRKDLVSGEEDDQGEILAPQEYSSLVAEISALSESEREARLTSILRPYPLIPLDELRKELEQETISEIVVFLGGPATALVELFKGIKGSKLRRKVGGLFGMFGSLQPGSATLFFNQFNVACDIEAACELLVDNMFPRAKKYLVTTETAKDESLVLSSQDLHEGGADPYFVNLQRLWESTHKGRAQPMFDVLPVMAYLEKYRACFRWNRKKGVLQELQKGVETLQLFSYADSDDHKHPLVSEATHNQEELSKEVFLKFVCKLWQ